MIIQYIYHFIWKTKELFCQNFRVQFYILFNEMSLLKFISAKNKNIMANPIQLKQMNFQPLMNLITYRRSPIDNIM